MYTIERAKKTEKESIIRFFNLNWKKAQLINDEILFQYYYEDGENLNIIIAKEGNDIVGMSGYIPSAPNYCWLSNILVKKDNTSPWLAVELVKWFKENKWHISCGDIVKSTAPLYEFLGYSVGNMKQYYKLFDKEVYYIASIVDKSRVSGYIVDSNEEYKIVELTEEEFISGIPDNFAMNRRPCKSKNYLIKRYYRFPYAQYIYKVFGVVGPFGIIDTLIVVREQEAAGRKILRIVDIIGDYDSLAHTYSFWERLGKENGYEYIDCQCHGIQDSIMNAMGFFYSDDDENIIPEYLAPLKKEKYTIMYAGEKDSGFSVFHADADMDRPNLWENV